MSITQRCFVLALLVSFAPPLDAQEPTSEPAPPPAASTSDAEGGARIERIEVWDRVEADGSLVRRQRNTVLLRDANGVVEYSQVGVPFFEATQEAELTLLVVAKPDGRELDLLATAPRDVAPLHPPNLPVHSDLRLLRAAVPSLETGDRITFETTVRTKPLVANGVWTELRFREATDAGAQRYELDVPESMPLVVHEREGLAAAQEERRDGRRIRRWTVSGSPVGEAEARDGAADDSVDDDGYEPDVAVTTFETWDEFVRWWGTLAPPEVDETVRAKAAELTAGATEPLARLRAIHRYVAQEIRYLSLPLGLGRYRARPPAEVIRTGLGDCKDKIRLLASLAESAGLAVEAVLVGVQRRRRLDAAPSPDQFDHVVARARIGETEVWMDPTSEMTPMGRLPAGARDLPGVALTGGPKAMRPELVTTPAKLPIDHVVTVDTTGAIEPAGTIRAKVRWTYSGDDEMFRLAFRYGTPENHRQLAELLGHAWTRKDKGKVVAARSGDPRDLESPFWLEYDVEWPMSASVWSKDWDFWIPLPDIELDEPPDAGDAGADKPLELSAVRRQRVTARFELPEGVAVLPPVPFDSKRELATYRSTYSVDGRILSLERELVVKVDSVAPAQFAELRSLRKLIDDDDSQEFDIAAAPSIVPVAAETATAFSDRCWEEQEAKKHAEAEKSCRRALELDPKLARAWNSLGVALESLGRPKEAEEAYRKVIEVDPDHAYATANLGLLAWNRGDRVEAERLLRRQIEIAPLEAFAYQRLGRFLLQEQKPTEAEEAFARAVKLDPEDEHTRRGLLMLRGALGRCEEPLAQLVAGPSLAMELEERALLASAVLEGDCRPLAPAASFFDRLRADAEAKLEKIDVAKPASLPFLAVAILAATWDATGRIALEQGDLAKADDYLAAAMALYPSAATAARRAELLRQKGDANGAEYHYALAAALPSFRRGAFRAQLEREIPSAGRRQGYESQAEEGTWRLRSVSARAPEAAGTETKVWILNAADGKMLATVGVPKALVQALGPGALTLPVPPGNRAQIARRATAHCNSSGDCSLHFEPAVETAGVLDGDAE